MNPTNAANGATQAIALSPVSAARGRDAAAIYRLAPSIQRRIVWYSGESFSQRRPPPWGRTFEPSTPSDSELDVGLRRIRLFSGSFRSITLSAVEYVALKSVCVAWQ